MRTHIVPARQPDEDRFLGKFFDASHYEHIASDTCRIVKPDGALLMVLLKRCLSPVAGKAMYNAIHERIAVTDNRGLATGQPRIQRTLADGTRSKSNRVDKGVHSSIFGFFDRYPRIPYCRKAALNAAAPATEIACGPALREASEAFRSHAPDRYAVQEAMAKKTHPDFVIPGTVFTTVTLNKNFRTAGHRDAGDLPDGFGVMSYYRSGKFSGGHLVFPAFRVAVQLDTYDVLLFDPHEIHGNTAVRPFGKAPYERITCVHYYRKGMYYCGSAAQELELAKRGNRSGRVKP